MKNIDETRNDFIERIILMCKKHKIYMALNYIEHWLVLAFAVIGFVSISAFTSLVCIPTGNTSSAVVL